MTILLTSMSSLMIPMTSTCLIKFKMGTCHGSDWPGNQNAIQKLAHAENFRYFCQPKLHPWWTRDNHPGWSLWYVLVLNTNLDGININNIEYFQLNIQLQVNSHQNIAIYYKGKNQNGSCSRQVSNMFKLKATEIVNCHIKHMY